MNMEFINANYEILVAIGLIIFACGIGIYLIPYLKNKKIVSQEDLDNTQDMINLALLVLKELNKNNDKKSDAELVSNVVDITFNYIEKNYDDINKDEKIKLANEFVVNVLEKINIELTAERKFLIRTGIDSIFKIVK